MSEALQIALMGPQASDYYRRAAAKQFGDATSTQPLQHWTQAAAQVLGGLGSSMRETQAAQNDQRVAALQKEALAKALAGGSLEDSASMLMGNPATSDMGFQLANSAISQRQQAAQSAAAQQAKLAAEQREFERQKELIRLRQSGGGAVDYGKSGSIVQGPDGRFFTVQFGSDGTRKILPLTIEQAQEAAQLGSGWAGIRGGEAPSAAQGDPISLAPAKGVTEVDTGTGTVLINKATGEPIRQFGKDIAGTEEQKIAGRTRGEVAANAPKAAATMRSLEQQWNLVNSSIDNALNRVNWSTVGFVGDWAKVVPGTPAYDLKETLEAIRANIGFDKLQDMRDNSPTGGALGQVSEFENRLLQSVRGSLQQGQSPDQLRANLQRVKQDLAALQAERRQAFNSTYGGQPSPAAQQPKTLVYDPQTGELRPK